MKLLALITTITIASVYAGAGSITDNVSADPVHTFHITGSVHKPGFKQFPQNGHLTVSEAIIMAGGILPTGDGSHVMRIRTISPHEKALDIFDVVGMMKSLDYSSDDYIQSNDIIIVPRIDQPLGFEHLKARRIIDQNEIRRIFDLYEAE